MNSFSTKDGRPIEFKVIKNDPEDGINQVKDRGWVLHKILAFVDGQEVGYLKISYIPKEDFKKLYPSPLYYKARVNGWGGLLPALESGDTEKILKEINSYTRSHSFFPYEKSEQLKLIKEEEKHFRKGFEEFRDFHMDKPLVDYIKVSDKWKRLGIGTALYQFGAQWLAKQGLALHASGLQQPEAAAAWAQMKKRQLPIVDVDHPMDKNKRRTVLDYRKMAQDVASKYARDLCNPNQTSAAWIDPHGKVYQIEAPLTHTHWADNLLRDNEEFQESGEVSWKWLINEGWVRFVNFLNMECGDKPPHQTLKAAAELVVGCALKRRDVDPDEIIFVGFGARTRQMRLGDFVREFGGREIEDRLYSGLSSRTAALGRRFDLHALSRSITTEVIDQIKRTIRQTKGSSSHKTYTVLRENSVKANLAKAMSEGLLNSVVLKIDVDLYMPPELTKIEAYFDSKRRDILFYLRTDGNTRDLESLSVQLQNIFVHELVHATQHLNDPEFLAGLAEDRPSLGVHYVNRIEETPAFARQVREIARQHKVSLTEAVEIFMKAWPGLRNAPEKEIGLVREKLNQTLKISSLEISYQLKWSEDRPFIYAFVPGFEFAVGEMELHLVDESFWGDGPCHGDVRKLLSRLAEKGRGNPRVYIVRNVFVEPGFRGQGIGKGMYEKVLDSAAPGKRGCVLLAERCVRGKTSPDATRVWGSITKRWMSEGFVVASVRR